MGGNVFQWTETLVSPSPATRRLLGGVLNDGSAVMRSSAHGSVGPTASSFNIGFRVAETPEPSTGVLAVIAGGMLWWWRKRFK